MNRTAPPKMNASSMADIAFLLLIFFLVTTTLDNEIGLQAILPPADTGKTSVQSNELDLEIFINSNGDLMIENKSCEWLEIRKYLEDFYLPETKRTQLISFDLCRNKLTSPDLSEKEKNLWKWRLDAVELNRGSYWELKEKSLVLIECSRYASYDTYIALQDSMHRVIKDLRRMWCVENGVKSYDDLDAADSDDRKIIRTLRLMYPLKIQDVEFESK